MQEKLTLNDGTELEGHAIESNGVLYIYMYNITFADVFELLIVPEKTERIDMVRYGNETVFTGYNHLFCLREESGGMISAGLKKVL